MSTKCVVEDDPELNYSASLHWSRRETILKN